MIPPRDVFAQAARKAIEDHAEWDSPHYFTTLHWDGDQLNPGRVVCIMPDIDPGDYSALMIRTALDALAEKPADPPYGYLLQIESFSVDEPGTDASDAERAQFERDRRNRTFHERDDAFESAVAWCADIHGRLWAAAQRRGSDAITERFYPPGPKQPQGRLIDGVLRVAMRTGTAAYGLPGASLLN